MLFAPALALPSFDVRAEALVGMSGSGLLALYVVTFMIFI
jgi:hypothetical protein